MNRDKTHGSSAATYTMGYSEDFQKLLRRRNAETSAAHLLPHLKPGMCVLDFGCGPGTISMGLAEAVEPGELHGIDMEESQIEMARGAASAGGHRNAAFQTADVTDLPFEDNSFDVAHCNALLMHVPDTKAVLAEVRRVLKPEGIVSSREMFVDSSFLEPELSGGWDTFSKLITVEAATKYGFATEEQFNDWRALLDQWRETPGALAGFAWGVAIGRK